MIEKLYAHIVLDALSYHPKLGLGLPNAHLVSDTQ